MRASELLGADVIDATGARVGRVEDIRVEGDSFALVGLVVGDGFIARLAHRWGYAQGRARGPWLLRRLMAGAVDAARFVPSGSVREWTPSVRVTVAAGDLPSLREEPRR